MRLSGWRGLRGRMLLLVGGAWVVFSTILWLVTTSFVDIGYRELERRQASETIQRMRGILEARMQSVDMKAHDWAEWNDMADWLHEGTPGFVVENVTDSAMAILRERDHGFFRKDGSLAALFSFDPRTRIPISADSACMRGVLPSADQSALGLYQCGDSIAIYAARPVHSTARKGFFGWIVFGHRIDGDEEGELSRILGKRVSIRLADPLPQARVESDSFSVLWFDLPLRGGGKVARVEILHPRVVHLVSLRVRRYLLIALCVLLVGGTLVSLWSLDMFVVRRILRLAGGVVSYQGVSMAGKSAFDDGGSDEIGELGGAIDDLVERLAAVQDSLEKSLDAAQAGIRAKSSFLASMSHDLRTPLNGMIGLTEFLAKTRLEPSQREAIDLLRGGSENLLTMINDILEFSRSEAGHEEIAPEEVSTEAIFHQPVRILAPMAHRQGIDISVVFDPDMPARLMIDAERMRQVLHNLVGNAVKFTDRGEVLIRAGHQPLAEGGHRLLVSVCDTGPGIPPETLSTIFDPFVQVSRESAKRRGGTGLGLTIAHRIVERMGGELRVRSREGEGSEFYFQIDVAAPPGVGAMLPNAFPWAGCDPVAVLVRRASLRADILDMLARVGLRTIELLLPESVFLQPESLRVSLLVSDIESLGEEDLRSLPIVRSMPAFVDAPVVLLSRTDLLDDAGVRSVDGVRAILRRPVPPTALLQAVEDALRPRARVVAHLPNPFLRTMATGMLSRRGHLVEILSEEESGVLSASPLDAILVDGDSPTLEKDLEVASRLHAGAALVQLGGEFVLPGAQRLERPFTAERLCDLVERIAHQARLAASRGA